MGLTFAQAKKLAPAIGEFSELGDYLALPTRTYSTGMFLRLAFAISSSIEPNILIMDEMIGAGDSKFVQKATRRLHELIGKANILALASHDMSLVRDLCNTVIWLEHGVIKQFGPTGTVLAAYRKANAPRDEGRLVI
jgi:ABC-type polysaccharide/polyol phosphate transport system ATPase subunit